MYRHEVYAQDIKRYFVLDAETQSLTMFKKIKAGQPVDQELVIEIEGDMAVTVDQDRLVIVANGETHVLVASSSFIAADWGEELRGIRKGLRAAAKAERQAKEAAKQAEVAERRRKREEERVARIAAEEAQRQAAREARERAAAETVTDAHNGGEHTFESLDIEEPGKRRQRRRFCAIC